MKNFRLCWDILKIVAGLIAGITLGISKIPDKPLLEYKPPTSTDPVPLMPALLGIPQEHWIIASIISAIAVAVIVAVDGSMAIVKAKRTRRDEALRKDIQRVLLASLKTLSESTGVNIVYLGASVFRYKKTKEGFKLNLLERYRLDDFPPRSIIKWTQGKGAIGAAAQKRTTVHCDWVALSQSLRNKCAPEDQIFSSLSDEDRFGFTDDELREMAGKYYESLATPILSASSRKILGVLAIDIPNRENISITQSLLGGRDKEERLAVPAAALLAQILEPDYALD
ncbi:hypothetical protein [Glutamicibacter nicotianae]|uniref:IclR-ED domain-containing protein n=1 Tax=Glutamicibacter nicotianae TaxID=37929 RepID=A0ABQ0RIH0_GLUNI|nr:hypothetical protein [Glutamicibacter nicotianae]GEC11587.1 hypothetical protein ANI01nite_07900 [Glutamicibacter nicotianae]